MCVHVDHPTTTPLGKTRLAQAVSSETDSRFYCISSADLLSSWVGESEKYVIVVMCTVVRQIDPSQN